MVFELFVAESFVDFLLFAEVILEKFDIVTVLFYRFGRVLCHGLHLNLYSRVISYIVSVMTI